MRELDGLSDKMAESIRNQLLARIEPIMSWI
jgi:hypothetical protein